jgi:hypothetical protein
MTEQKAAQVTAPGDREYAPPGTPSRYYAVDPDDPDAPRVVLAYHGAHHGPLAPGDTVEYDNPSMPGLGSPAPDGLPLVLAELVDLLGAEYAPEAIFTDTEGGQYECSADNLRAVTG